MGFDTPQSLAQELVLFVDNDGDLYRGQTTSIIKNLVTKIARGTYDPEKAVQLFMYLAESGAKKYAREYGDSESNWHKMFPVEVRRLAASHWRDAFETEAKLGNYDNLLPKKYQNPAPKKIQRSSKLPLTDYQAGSSLAQDVASNLTEKELRSIVHRNYIPAKLSKKSDTFKRGYLDRLNSIYYAIKGN